MILQPKYDKYNGRIEFEIFEQPKRHRTLISIFRTYTSGRPPTRISVWINYPVSISEVAKALIALGNGLNKHQNELKA